MKPKDKQGLRYNVIVFMICLTIILCRWMWLAGNTEIKIQDNIEVVKVILDAKADKEEKGEK